MADKEKAAKAATETEAAEKKSKKAPKPDGYVSPVEYAKHRSELLGKLVRPQTIYSYIRNTKGFPFETNTDGRYMINVKVADEWFEERAKAKEARAKAKEAEAEAES